MRRAIKIRGNTDYGKKEEHPFLSQYGSLENYRSTVRLIQAMRRWIKAPHRNEKKTADKLAGVVSLYLDEQEKSRKDLFADDFLYWALQFTESPRSITTIMEFYKQTLWFLRQHSDLVKYLVSKDIDTLEKDVEIKKSTTRRLKVYKNGRSQTT